MRLTLGATLALYWKLAPRNLLPLSQSFSSKCLPASHMVSRYPAPSPLGAIIIPRVSSALWIPQSRESHESICHHSPPWKLRRAESQASQQSTSVSPCASPVLLVNPWRSPAGKPTKIQESLVQAFCHTSSPPHHHA